VIAILYYGNITCDVCLLFEECSWGIEQDLGIVTCNTEDLLVTGLVCVCLEVFLTALYLRLSYSLTFTACTALKQMPHVPECRWEVLGNMRHCVSGVQAVDVGQ